MTTELYCRQCEKRFQIPIDDMNLMLKHYEAHLHATASQRFEYTDSCFFKDLAKLKRQYRSRCESHNATMA